jgi:hypothetical protein
LRRERPASGSSTVNSTVDELKILLGVTVREILEFLEDINKEMKRITTIEGIIEKKEIAQLVVKIKKVSSST